jgi:hypothetical protein
MNKPNLRLKFYPLGTQTPNPPKEDDLYVVIVVAIGNF